MSGAIADESARLTPHLHMNAATALARLRAETARFGASPFLLTTGDDGRPHAVAVTYSWDGDALRLNTGRRSAANVALRPRVSLLWAPIEASGYSLILDGEAVLGDSAEPAIVVVQPTRAVLHRPGQAVTGGTDRCTADCVPLLG